MSLAFVAEPLSASCWSSRSPSPTTASAPAAKVVDGLENGGVALLENVRFHAGEEKNDPTSPRPWPPTATSMSTTPSAPPTAPTPRPRPGQAAAGLSGPVDAARAGSALDAALGNPKKPVIGIVGGSKVSTKLDLLNNLVAKLDRLAIGGGMANTFLFAQGHDVGGSLCEKDLADTAREIIEKAKAAGCELLLPVDVVVAKKVAPGVETAVRALDEVQADDLILDAGPESAKRLLAAMDEPDPDLERPAWARFRSPAVRRGDRFGGETRRRSQNRVRSWPWPAAVIRWRP
jgi:phosphoglycerate kinase